MDEHEGHVSVVGVYHEAAVALPAEDAFGRLSLWPPAAARWLLPACLPREDARHGQSQNPAPAKARREGRGGDKGGHRSMGAGKGTWRSRRAGRWASLQDGRREGGRIMQPAYFLPRTLLLHLIGDRGTFCPVRGTGQCVGRLVISINGRHGGEDDTAAVLRAFSSPAPWARGLSGSRWPSAPHLGKREIMVGLDCPRGGLWMGPSTCLLRRGGRDEAGQRSDRLACKGSNGCLPRQMLQPVGDVIVTGWRGFAGELKNSLAEGPEITGTNEKGMGRMCAGRGLAEPTRHGSQRRSR